MDTSWRSVAFPLFAVALPVVGCSAPGASSQPTVAATGAAEPRYAQTESTRRMVKRLDEHKIYGEANLQRFLNRQLSRVTTGGQLPIDLRSAYVKLYRGESREALPLFEKLKQSLKQAPPEVANDKELSKMVHEGLAIAALRVGEQANCVGGMGHDMRDACIFPLRGSGIHQHREGARRAITEYQERLSDPNLDPRLAIFDRWLLNIAYMAVDEYPASVPEAYRVDPKRLESEREVPRFTNIAALVAADRLGHSGAGVFEDFDNDGYFDIIASSAGFDPKIDQIHYYHNDRNAGFSEWTDRAGLTGLVDGLHVVKADYNNDGYIDLFIPRGAFGGGILKGVPSSLLKNDRGVGFDDVTEQAGLLFFHYTQTAAWADYDNDGWLDLYVGKESKSEITKTNKEFREYITDNTQPGQLWHSNRDGTFTDVTAAAGVGVVGFIKGIAWGDYDNDGRPDLYVSNYFEPNVLFHNDGPDAAGSWKFTDVTARAGVAEPIKSMTTWFFDYDNDGWLDLFVGDHREGGDFQNPAAFVSRYVGMPMEGDMPRLYKNNRDGTFTDVTKAMHLDRTTMTMASDFGDFDSDGWPDMYLGTGAGDLRLLLPNLLFRNAEGAYFQDVSTSAGVGHLQKGHGIAFGDIDRDGDLDLHAGFGGAHVGDVFQNALFVNPGNGNRWLALKLEGVRSNRSAIGARIKVTVQTAAGPRDIHALVSNGSSFGASPFEQHIGLGTATTISKVEIRWPSGEVQTVPGLEANHRYVVREGDAKTVSADLVPIVFRGVGAQRERHDASRILPPRHF